MLYHICFIIHVLNCMYYNTYIFSFDIWHTYHIVYKIYIHVSGNHTTYAMSSPWIFNKVFGYTRINLPTGFDCYSCYEGNAVYEIMRSWFRHCAPFTCKMCVSLRRFTLICCKCRFRPYSAAALFWSWANHAIARGPVKQCLGTWVNWQQHSKAKQNDVHNLGDILYVGAESFSL